MEIAQTSEVGRRHKGSVRETRPALEERGDIVPVLLTVSKQTRILFGIKLGELGLFNGQDQMLSALDEDRPRTMSELAEVLEVRCSTASKMVDRLEERGLVARASDKMDARRCLLRLTPGGTKVRHSIEDVWTQLGEDVLGDDEESVGLLHQELCRLQKRLEAKIRRLR